MARQNPPEIGELKALGDDPPAQAARAIALLELRRGAPPGNGIVQAALDVLVRHPQDESRGALIALYGAFCKHESRDPACYLRSRIVQALRPITRLDDVPFLLDAAHTYVFPPPQFTEEGWQLRGNALLAMVDLEPDIAGFVATRLLFDAHTAPMSGEPAATAAQVLGRLGELLPLYAYVMQAPHHLRAEVGAAALRGLSPLPRAMLEQVIRRFTAGTERDSADFDDQDSAFHGPMVAGLFDLLLSLEPIPVEGVAYLRAFMQENSPLDLYRYLATLLTTTNTEAAWALFDEISALETVPVRVNILREALAVAPDVRRAARFTERLNTRRAAR